jgi:hypothetical protein
MRCALFAMVVAVCIAAPSLQAAVIDLVPVRASGDEGVDWEFGPGTYDITLFSAGQFVEVQVLVSGFGQQAVAGYELTIDCDSLEAGQGQGRALASSIDCTKGEGVFGVDYCLGVDESEPTYLLGAADSTIAACQRVELCPNGDPGSFACGAVAISGDSGVDLGSTFYASTFSLEIPPDLLGTVAFDLSDNPNRTYLRDTTVSKIPIDAVNRAFIRVPVGACCGAVTEPLECGNLTTIAECNALGGVHIPNTSCSGADSCTEGLDDTCPSCFAAEDCDDGNACTADSCDGTDCCSSLDTTPPGQCCDSITGDLTVIDDGNACTIDVCNSDGSVDHIPDDGAACDDGEACTDGDVCVGATCMGSLIAQVPAASPVGSKYLSVTALGDPTDQVALLVTSPDWPCLNKYIAADGQLQDTPFTQSVSAWETVLVTGLEIAPESTYDIRSECGGLQSDATTVVTGIYSDIDNSGGVNLADAQLVVFGFQLNFKFNTLEELDIWPCVPNDLINFEDIQHAVLAFQLTGYDAFCPPPCE